MILRLLFSLLLTFSAQINSGVSFKKSDKKSKQSTAVIDIIEKPSTDDLALVNTRLRVEGAKFRSFNLLFNKFGLSDKLDPKQKKLAVELREIIERDLAIVGGINFVAGSNEKDPNNDPLLKQKGVEGKTNLSLEFIGDRIKATVKNHNFMSGRAKSTSMSIKDKGLRNLAHKLSQTIYEEFIGAEDIFTMQIAAVKRSPQDSQIVLMDFDGKNERVLSSGSSVKSSPYFAPGAKSILYTEISAKSGQRIVEQELHSKALKSRTDKTGLNIDARVLPDNSGMLATLSFQGMPNIYKARRDGSGLSKITDSLGLNLSPSISTDGRLLAFVSTRSGSPQIFEQSMLGGPAKRLTFKGAYNQTPHFSPDGSLIAFTGRDENNVFDIFLIERSSGRVTRVTEKQGRNQEPFFSPSGRYVIFTSERNGNNDPGIFIATLNGDHQYRLSDTGSYYSPVIGPNS